MSLSRRTVTVVFADIVDSTPLGERLDPERVRLVLTRYFDLSRGLLERYGGTVEKFVGDALSRAFSMGRTEYYANQPDHGFDFEARPLVI
jgi:class 3 adenylate cyclase